MLHDPAAHESLIPLAWDASRARRLIERIAAESAAHFANGVVRPVHPRDGAPQRALHGELYHGAGGVLWALHHLNSLGATRARIDAGMVMAVLQRHQEWQASFGGTEFGSYFMGDIALWLLRYALEPSEAIADRIEALIRGNLHNPARELMWGAPGTLLVAWFLHQHTQAPRWAELFRLTARTLWSQLLWSNEHRCHYWAQDRHGERGTYLDAVHGFAGATAGVVRGRSLLGADEWRDWQRCIENTIERTATVEGDRANWRVFLEAPAGAAPRMQMQFCHGAPGFVACLAELPGPALDALLLAAGEATWAAGPLVKGANLCHGTGGNGYAFLKLFQRTNNERWLDRARAFAMHGIEQCEGDAVHFGQMHHSLWTGDPGFAIYLWDCIRGEAAFPCLDVFFSSDRS
ncbi:MAG TPA: LanC-like protein [Caldimonas sp.]